METIEVIKKIKILVDKLGNVLKINTDGSINVNVVDSVEGDTVDVPGEWKPITTASFVTLVTINADSSKTIFIKNIDMSMTGHSAIFIIEKVDNSGTTFIRQFHLNYQYPTFDKHFGNSIPLKDEGNSEKIIVKAKMNWQGQTGHAIASINGYK